MKKASIFRISSVKKITQILGNLFHKWNTCKSRQYGARRMFETAQMKYKNQVGGLYVKSDRIRQIHFMGVL